MKYAIVEVVPADDHLFGASSKHISILSLESPVNPIISVNDTIKYRNISKVAKNKSRMDSLVIKKASTDSTERIEIHL